MSYKKHTVVPAESNWYALDWCLKNDDGIFVTKEPVVAWTITIVETNNGTITSTSPNPVTQDELSGFYEGAILRPDGSVVIRGIQFWHTFEDYEKDVKKRHFNNQTSIMNKQEANYAASF